MIYWYFFSIFMPKKLGYKLVEETTVLEDGTRITKLVKDKL